MFSKKMKTGGGLLLAVLIAAGAFAMNIEVIPSGILPLDIALGVGGVPRGRIIEVYGPESSGKTTVTLHMEPFIQWVVGQVREHHWSLDACVGYARLHQLFPKEAMVCTKTLYNMLIYLAAALQGVMFLQRGFFIPPI